MEAIGLGLSYFTFLGLPALFIGGVALSFGVAA
jgi:hypothetical protein